MDAKIFQEINAFENLSQTQTEIQQAKQAYQQSFDTAGKQQAIALWQTGIDKLRQLPPDTVANRQAITAHQAYVRDFRQVSGLVAGNNRTNKLIAVVKKFQSKANDSCSQSFHPVHRWQQCMGLLDRAIKQLGKVALEDEGYLEAQTLLANYEAELAEMRIRQQEESDSQRAYELAQSIITNLPKTINQANRDRTANQILTIINQLEKVQPDTTVYRDSLMIMSFTNKKLRQLQ